jgi:hypothetical protein
MEGGTTTRDAAWRDWYRAQHDRRCLQNGQAFEDYATTVLAVFHSDYVNPTPAGSLGDGGSDGIAERGDILYACYGSRAQRDAERKLRDKMRSDFNRGLGSWTTFTKWRFVTNALAGPLATACLVEIQQAHRPGSTRPIVAMIWNPDRLWWEVVAKLSPIQLDGIFPGVPHAANVELADLVLLLDALAGDEGSASIETIRPVPPTKMDFNQLGAGTRAEFNEGRLSAPRIDAWYRAQADPDLRDVHARKFRRVYEEQRRATNDPGELVERLYVSLAGPNVRLDTTRANSAYAITAYFFDSCDIFEEPELERDTEKGVEDATAH